MRNRNRSLLIIVSAAVLAVSLAACGGDDNSTTSGSTGATGAAQASSGGSTVSVQTIGGNDVLVDTDGNALYTNDMDTTSTIACTGECATIWVPLAAPSSGQPTSDDSSVNGKLGTVDRPDGTTQVTFDGMPMYSFVQDSPGQVTGDGFADSFGGTDFVWTVASNGGGTDTETTDSSSSGGGYGY
jgi:predicted lipoprotein with Yx(FWY)xxD motif